MGTLPATGTEIRMGAVAAAYGLDSLGNGGGTVSNVKLNEDLGAEIGKILDTETKLSEDFGGLTTPYPYPS